MPQSTDNNQQNIPVRKFTPDNNRAPMAQNIHASERIRFNEHIERPGCVPGQICKPCDVFDIIQKCEICEKVM